MSTAVTVIKRALNIVGAHSEVMPADPELISIGLEELTALLGELDENEVYIGAEVESVTSSGTTATVNKTAHGFIAGRKVLISGADQANYNGEFTIATVSANSFTYTIPAAATTPATGTIRALQYPEKTGDELGEARGVARDLQYFLARAMAPICRIPITLDAKNQADAAVKKLWRHYQAPTIPNVVPSRLLPRGQGSSRGQWAKPFFSGDALDDDSSTPT